jgi:riboflavin synthase
VFTGIVEEIGRVTAARRTGEVLVLTVLGPTACSDARLGDSIAVSGVCLTVTHVDAAAGSFDVELVPETLARTSLAGVADGTRVNLERAVAVGGRLGGHIVQGHVDGVGTLIGRNPGARSDELRFTLPAELARYVVEKGSITVDGVSLTVAGIDDGTAGSATFTVALIPTTLAHTTLGTRAPGDPVNLEVDVVAKYVERLARGYDNAGQGRPGNGTAGMATTHATDGEQWTVER